MEVQNLVKQMQVDPLLVDRIKDDPVGAIRHAAAGTLPLASDVLIYRIVVLALGLGVVVSILGALTLAFFGKPTPEVVTALGSACVGALAGLLAPSPARS